MGNQNSLADAYSGKGNFYNQLPNYYYSDETMRAEYYGSNSDRASDYIQDITRDCGSDEEGDPCWYTGNNFSAMYTFSAYTMMILAFNSWGMFFGTWSAISRSAAGICVPCCGCLNLACIITTAVFRFNTWGKLSALCDGPSKYKDDGLSLSDDRTVSGDASLILGLWVAQMIYCCASC